MGTANNSKLIFMPLDAAGVMGSIGGIMELVKDAQTSARSSGGTSAPPSGGGPGPWNRT